MAIEQVLKNVNDFLRRDKDMYQWPKKNDDGTHIHTVSLLYSLVSFFFFCDFKWCKIVCLESVDAA